MYSRNKKDKAFHQSFPKKYCGRGTCDSDFIYFSGQEGDAKPYSGLTREEIREILKGCKEMFENNEKKIP
jgi:hypothetical protein